MTVGELIERLKLLDQNAEVETGYGSVDEVQRISTTNRPVVKLVHYDSHTLSTMRADQLRRIERLKLEQQLEVEREKERARRAVLPWEEQ